MMSDAMIKTDTARNARRLKDKQDQLREEDKEERILAKGTTQGNSGSTERRDKDDPMAGAPAILHKDKDGNPVSPVAAYVSAKTEPGIHEQGADFAEKNEAEAQQIKNKQRR